MSSPEAVFAPSDVVRYSTGHARHRPPLVRIHITSLYTKAPTCGEGFCVCLCCTKRMIPAGFYTKSITLFFCFFPRNLPYELPVRELLKDYSTCSGIRSYEIESSSKLILYIGSPFSLAISDRIFS